MRRLPRLTIYLILTLLIAQSLRGYVADRLAAKARAEAKARSVMAWRAGAELTARIAPESPDGPAIRGQALLLLANASEPEVGRLVAAMAEPDLRRALARNPADASLWVSAALAAKLAGRASTAEALADEAVRRATHLPEYAWISARLHQDGPAKRAAYRRVTELRPGAVPAVLAEASPGAALEAQAAFVAPTAAAYRVWAWSLTGETGIRIARQGLAFAAGRADARIDAGWLSYYLGLQIGAADPRASLTWYRAAVAALPGEQAVYRNYGFALLRAGRPADAARAFGESIRLHGDLSNASHLGLAEAWVAIGNTTEARRVLQRLTKHARLEAWVRREAGDELYRLEQAQ